MKKLTLLISVFAFISCGKEEAATPIDQLTNGGSKAWALGEYLINEKSILTDCLKDDVFFFAKTTGEYTWKKGTAKCEATEKDQTFKFTLSADNKVLNVGGNNWQVVSLTNDLLEIKTDVFSGTIHKIKYKKI